MRKYVKTESLEKNTNIALKFLKGLIKNDIIDYSSVVDNAFCELGFQVDIYRTKVDNPGGYITLKWTNPSIEDRQELLNPHRT